MIASVAADLRRYPRARLPISRTVYRRMRNGASSPASACRRTAQGDAFHTSRGGAALISTRAIWRAASRPMCRRAGGALSVEDLASFRAYVASHWQIPYRGGQGLRDAGTHLRPRPWPMPCACCRRVCQPGRATGCLGLHAYALALQSASRNACKIWATGRPPRAGRRTSAPACTTHFSVSRSRGNNGGGDAEPCCRRSVPNSCCRKAG